MLLLTVFLVGCEQRGSYQRGYDSGYQAGVTNGHDVGYREGYEQGYTAARPNGAALAEQAVIPIRIGSFLGGLGVLLGLGYCLFGVFAADLTPPVVASKTAAIAVAVLLASVAIFLLAAHRLPLPLLLSGRFEQPLALTLATLGCAAPFFLGAAWLDSVARRPWSRARQALLVGLLAFSIWTFAALVVALLQTPGPERYLFSYLGLGALLGLMAFVAFRLIRKADGW